MKMTITRPGVAATRLNVETVSQGNLGDNGRPVAFILPGGPGNALTLYQSYSCLKEVTDLVFHDPRGCGQSDKSDPAICTMNNYIDDVEAIRLQLGLRIIVIGKSYGSICGLGYALRYPNAVQRLVLAAGAPSFRFLDSAKANLKRRGTPEQIKVCKKLWAGSFKNADELLAYLQLTNTLYSVKARTSSVNSDSVKRCGQISMEVLNEGFKNEFWHFDYEHELHKVLCPTLILAGREDWIIDVKFAEYMSARIPHSQLMIFDNASHAMEVDVTEEYFQRLADFVNIHS